MNITEIVQSKGWKNFMAKLYGIGAAVVIVGALFKIMHWPGAGPMLVLGLGTEAVIFFFSAFEPLHEEVDWSLVYPELAGMPSEEEEEEYIKQASSSRQSALDKFDAMIESAEITPALFEKLGQGLKNLNQTTLQLSDLSDASLVTNEYVTNVKSASESMTGFAELVSKTGGDVTGSIVTSGKALADSYQRMSDEMNKEFTTAAEGNKTYADQLESMTKNLTALNAAYELQLQGTNDHLESSKKMYDGLDDMMTNLKDSVDDTKRYKEEVSKLGQNLAALNTVYGNMLTAMNITNPNA